MAEKSNLLPFLIGGGLLLAVAAYFFMKSSSTPTRVMTGQPGQPGQMPCRMPDGSAGVVGAAGICMPPEAAALTAVGTSLANPLVSLVR